MHNSSSPDSIARSPRASRCVLARGVLSGALLLLVALGCEEQVEDPALAEAHGELVRALGARDSGALFDLSPPEFRREMEALAGQLAGAARLLDQAYPRADAQVIWRHAGLALLDAGPTGRDVFVTLYGFSGFRWGEDVQNGLAGRSAAIDGDRAVVSTAAGESFEYLRGDDGQWSSTLASQTWAGSEVKELLLENLEQLHKNAAIVRAQIHSVLDPRQVAGAHNTLRQAVAKADYERVYSLLDKPVRSDLDGIVGDVVEGRAAGRRLSGAGSITNALALLKRFWKTPAFASGLPEGDEAKIADIDLPGSDHAIVRTLAGDRLEYRRGAQDVWRLAELPSARKWLYERTTPAGPSNGTPPLAPKTTTQ